MSHITSSLAEAYYGQTVRLTHTGNYHSAPQIDIVALGISGESFIDDGDGGYYEFTMTDCNVTVKKHNGN